MRRIGLNIMVLCGLLGLTACTFSTEASSKNSDVISSSEADFNESGVISDKNITNAKCYKVDFQTVTEDEVAALFRTAPTKSTNEFGTTAFVGSDEKASLGRSSGVGGKGTYNTVLYYTEQGNKYDTAAYKNFSETAVNKDWSFMSASDAERKIAEIAAVFMPTGASIKTYAISADYYSEYVKNNVDDKLAYINGELAEKEEYDGGIIADYYYFTIEQTVDGIPIQSELIGNIDNGTQTWGSEGSAVLSADGLGYLHIFSPYKVVNEIEAVGKFITLSEAEQMFKNKSDSFLTTEEITLEYSRLVYVVLRGEDNSLILTPAWEFKFNGGQFFRVNAYTGEEVVTV